MKQSTGLNIKPARIKSDSGPLLKQTDVFEKQLKGMLKQKPLAVFLGALGLGLAAGLWVRNYHPSAAKSPMGTH